MFVPEKLKVNKLKQFDLPKPKDFVRVNGVSAFKELSASAYTGESSADTGNTKISGIVKAGKRMRRAVDEHIEKLTTE